MTTSEIILDTPMPEGSDVNGTIRDYLTELLAQLWQQGSGFSGKRPLGNSGWQYDFYEALAAAGHITATFDEDGFIEDLPDAQRDKADKLISDAILHLGGHES